MTIKDWQVQAQQTLQDHGIETARLDVLVLLEDRLGKDRALLLAHPEIELTREDENVLIAQIERRAMHVPLSYIRGKSEFYGRAFIISDAVLEPRPESEAMIDLLKELVTGDNILRVRYAQSRTRRSRLDRESSNTEPEIRNHPSLDSRRRGDDESSIGSVLNDGQSLGLWVADVGTGSGALGITASLELPKLQIDLLEIDDKALKVAQSNVVAKATANRVISSDLLTGSPQSYDILLCNLPYVPDDFQINTAASHEPAIAIFGGSDGLDLYRKLFDQVQNRVSQPLYILIEILPFQKQALVAIAALAGYELTNVDDFIHVFTLRKTT